ncbi:MAG TPA: LysR substrate-binding domain-containing protein [Aliidongia sp.]|nr:LysR substrate-binding domain-containing protein [Aliidongia sp.]
MIMQAGKRGRIDPRRARFTEGDSFSRARPHHRTAPIAASLPMPEIPTGKEALPAPLQTLRVFEAVARHSSFTQAAAELQLTQSAVSRQVKSLEAILGVDLFWRTTRKVELTEQGHFYAGIIRGALDRIEEATQELIQRGDGGCRLTIRCPSGFSGKWLVPRLASFQASHPDIDLQLMTADGPIERLDYDLAIGFGPQSEPDGMIEPILEASPLLVCRPDLVVSGMSPSALLRRHGLLQVASTPGLWQEWLEHAGIETVDLRWGPTFEHALIAISAAVSGLGLALLPRQVVADELSDGRLTAPFGRDVGGPPLFYHLVIPPTKVGLARVTAFRDWVREQIRQETFRARAMAPCAEPPGHRL